MEVKIGGDINFTLADDGNANNGTNNLGVTVPVALILEQYNPDIFYSQDTTYQTKVLSNRTDKGIENIELVYSPNLAFKVTGTIESTSIYNTKVDIDTTYDREVNGNYDAGVLNNENLWVARGSLPTANSAPDVIINFGDGADKIGFVIFQK